MKCRQRVSRPETRSLTRRRLISGGRTMNENDNYQTEFQSVIEAAFRASADVGKEVEQILQQGREHPLTPEEAAALLRKVIEVVKSRAAERGDEKTLHA